MHLKKEESEERVEECGKGEQKGQVDNKWHVEPQARVQYYDDNRVSVRGIPDS